MTRTTGLARFVVAVGALLSPLLGAAPAQGHIFRFFAGMDGQQMIPATGSSATGRAVLLYNHHAILYDMDIFVEGITLADLKPTGPNGTSFHAYYFDTATQTNVLALDLDFFAPPVEEAGGVRLVLQDVFLGDQQGAVWSDTFIVEDMLFTDRLFLMVHTNDFPDGEIRGTLRFAGVGSCPADVNFDGVVDVRDFFAFIVAFQAGAPAADLTIDGIVDVQDFFTFIIAFLSGCDG